MREQYVFKCSRLSHWWQTKIAVWKRVKYMAYEPDPKMMPKMIATPSRRPSCFLSLTLSPVSSDIESVLLTFSDVAVFIFWKKSNAINNVTINLRIIRNHTRLARQNKSDNSACSSACTRSESFNRHIVPGRSSN